MLTQHLGKQWVNVTTLPMLYATYPLYELVRTPGAPALPDVRAGPRRARGPRPRPPVGGGGGAAFWLIGLASPVVVYALDFWEHTIGLALMAWAVVLVVDVVRGEAGWRAALGAGLLFGPAASMRTEALVYGAVTGLVVAVVLVRRDRRLAPVAAFGALLAAGLGVVLAANQLLERITAGGSIRARVAPPTRLLPPAQV